MGDPAASILVPGTRALREETPLGLLSAHHEVVPFQGRAEELAALQHWCEGEGDVRVRLLHGPPGMGKTRLVIELCKRLRERAWRAGFVADAARIGELLESDDPVLAAIDPAESIPALQDVLEGIAGKSSRKPLRILLLASTAGEWWLELLRKEGPVATLLTEDEPLALSTLGASREAMFHAAAQAFAERRGEAAPTVAPELGDPRYENVLYLHLAALAAVEGRTVDVDALLESTLHREEQRWSALLAQEADETALDLRWMRRTVAAITLLGGAKSELDARALLGGTYDASKQRMMALAHALYPGCVEPFHVAGLTPSLLGDALVRRVLREEDAPERYLASIFADAKESSLLHGLMTLGRMPGDITRPSWIAALLGKDKVAYVMAARAAATRIGPRQGIAIGTFAARAVGPVSLDVVERVAGVLPLPSHTRALYGIGKWVAERFLLRRDDKQAPNAERARLLTTVGAWQTTFDKHQAARATLKAAERHLRALAASQPQVSQPDLAATLQFLGAAHRELGEQEAALASFTEAAALLRACAAERPALFRADLAECLKALGRQQSAVGQEQASIASLEEAVLLWRTMMASRRSSPYREMEASTRDSDSDGKRGRFQAMTPEEGLARSLASLAGQQVTVEKGEAAAASIRESITLFRAMPRSPVTQRALASAIKVRSLIEAALGRPEALSSAREALETVWPRPADLPSEHDDVIEGLLELIRKLLDERGEAPWPDLARRIEIFERRRLALRVDDELRDAPSESDPRWIVFQDTCEGELSDAHHPQLARSIATALGDPGRVESAPGMFRWSPTSGSRALAIIVLARDGKTRVRIHEQRSPIARWSLELLDGILPLLLLVPVMFAIRASGLPTDPPIVPVAIGLAVIAVVRWIGNELARWREHALTRTGAILRDAVAEGIAARKTRVRVAARIAATSDADVAADAEMEAAATTEAAEADEVARGRRRSSTR